MKRRTISNRYKLGDLIAALFEEARRVSSNQVEQTALVYAALKDLLDGKVRPAHPVLLKIRKF
jgi:hypothetical protein